MNYNFRGAMGSRETKKKEKSFIIRVSKQLTGVLIIILVLMLFKYTKTSIGNNLNKLVVDNFYVDYSTRVVEVFKKYSPEVNQAVETFVKNVGKQ